MVGSSQSKDSKEQALVPAENLMCDHDASSIKRRKLVQKTVVAVKIEANDGKHKCEGPPSDFWSWRKYGQKPIKGSPYPRGYYRCSTSKGCSAKKQVERCRTDASVLIITYTSDHNHPGPHLQNLPISEENTNPLKELSQEIVSEIEDPSSSSSATPEPTLNTEISPLQSNPIPLVDQEIKEEHQLHHHHHHHHIELNIVALSSSTTTSTTPPKTSELEDNDFFDELEELPMMSSSFTSFMRGSFFDDRILLLP